MFDNNITPNSLFNKANPYSKVDTANGMPIDSMRIVDPVNNGSRSREFAQKYDLRNIYAKNLTPSTGSTTDSFLKSRFLLSPVFNNVEAKSKYDMISRLENKISQVRTQVQLLV